MPRGVGREARQVLLLVLLLVVSVLCEHPRADGSTCKIKKSWTIMDSTGTDHLRNGNHESRPCTIRSITGSTRTDHLRNSVLKFKMGRYLSKLVFPC